MSYLIKVIQQMIESTRRGNRKRDIDAVTDKLKLEEVFHKHDGLCIVCGKTSEILVLCDECAGEK